MKKIVVMSDNHGVDGMMDYIRSLEPDADYYIHCGDSEADDTELLEDFICVRGNNDWSIDLPDEQVIKIEGVPIYITHGHRFGYFNRELAMNDALTRHHCKILFSGHTHVPMFEQEGDFYYINPGSTTLPRGGSPRSYAVVMLDKDHVECQFKTLE